MGKLAFLFSGQGAQTVGMGKDLYQSNPVVKMTYDELSSIARDAIEISFSGSEEELKRTKNTQPALFAMEMAIERALVAENVRPDGFAGFSIGELAALSSSGAYSAIEGMKIVMKRAEAMEKATKQEKTAMVAVLRLSDEKVEEIAKRFEKAYPVNYNSPGQVVVALAESILPAFLEEVKKAGGTPMTLNVSGGFHSPFMEKASEELALFLNGTELKSPQKPVYANLTGEVYPSDIRSFLSMQVKSPVLWVKTIENLKRDGYDTVVEIGPGHTLSSLVKRIDKSFRIFNAGDRESFEKTVAALSGENNG